MRNHLFSHGNVSESDAFFHCFYQVLKTESGGLILGLDFKIETATREVRPEAYMTVL